MGWIVLLGLWACKDNAAVDDSGCEHPGDYFTDADGDGYGDPLAPIAACEVSPGVVEDDQDCDDTRAEVNPGAQEVCDGLDNSCDDQVDPAGSAGERRWYRDQDGDGFGVQGTSVEACDAPSGYADAYGDCDDFNAALHPEAPEFCDDVDSDCDGDLSDGEDGEVWYADSDGDGFGDSESTVLACEQPDDHVAQGGDCDDERDFIHPDALEVCDGYDNDCDGEVDGADAPALTWTIDNDGDGYGEEGGATLESCSTPSGYARIAGDCDDTEPTVNPGESEVCNDGLDNNCDGDSNGCERTGTYDLSTVAGLVLSGRGSDGLGFNWNTGAGDQDGDGLDDVLVGAPESNTAAGGAYLVAGGATGAVDLSAADAQLSGQARDDDAGLRLSWVGDFDGDGLDDVAVGAWGNDLAGSDIGAVYLVSGPAASGALSDLPTVFTGVNNSDHFGQSVAGVGDLDGDGLSELLVGATGVNGGARDSGAAYLFSGGSVSADSGQAALALWGVGRDDGAGTWVSGAGDVEGDGVPDLLVGAYLADGGATSSGSVYLVSGAQLTDMSLADADATLQGGARSDAFGWSADSVGDIDDDGYDDVLVGAYGDSTGGSGAGAAYLYLGPLAGEVAVSSADFSFIGESAGSYAGIMVAGAGDLNGDARPDIAIGAYHATGGDARSGVVYVYYGPVSGGVLSGADLRLEGTGRNDFAGSGISGGGDVDGDGYDDLLVGAYGAGGGAGAAYLVFGQGI